MVKSNGNIDINVSGGVAPYTFQWEKWKVVYPNSYFAPAGSSEDLQNAEAGEYQVTIMDANGCEVFIDDIMVIEPDAVFVSCAEKDPPIGEQTYDGVAEISVENVSGTWTAELSTPGDPSRTEYGVSTDVLEVNGLRAGNYSVTITDNQNGCESNCYFTLTKQPCSVELQSATITDNDCNGDVDGIIDITLINGITPYAYAWSNGATTEDVQGLIAGNYIVTVTEDNGCVSAFPFVVTAPTPIKATILTEDISCSGANDGEISLSVSGGTSPYTYNWNNGITTTTDMASGLVPGTYRVTINRC